MIGSVSTPTCWPSTASCSCAAGRFTSSEAISTLRLSRSVRRLAILAAVVVLPAPCRPIPGLVEPRGGSQLEHGVEVDRRL